MYKYTKRKRITHTHTETHTHTCIHTHTYTLSTNKFSNEMKLFVRYSKKKKSFEIKRKITEKYGICIL